VRDQLVALFLPRLCWLPALSHEAADGTDTPKKPSHPLAHWPEVSLQHKRDMLGVWLGAVFAKHYLVLDASRFDNLPSFLAELRVREAEVAEEERESRAQAQREKERLQAGADTRPRTVATHRTTSPVAEEPDVHDYNIDLDALLLASQHTAHDVPVAHSDPNLGGNGAPGGADANGGSDFPSAEASIADPFGWGRALGAQADGLALVRLLRHVQVEAVAEAAAAVQQAWVSRPPALRPPSLLAHAALCKLQFPAFTQRLLACAHEASPPDVFENMSPHMPPPSASGLAHALAERSVKLPPTLLPAHDLSKPAEDSGTSVVMEKTEQATDERSNVVQPAAASAGVANDSDNSKLTRQPSPLDLKHLSTRSETAGGPITGSRPHSMWLRLRAQAPAAGELRVLASMVRVWVEYVMWLRSNDPANPCPEEENPFDNALLATCTDSVDLERYAAAPGDYAFSRVAASFARLQTRLASADPDPALEPDRDLACGGLSAGSDIDRDSRALRPGARLRCCSAISFRFLLT
jgi:hypothetical protein